MIPLPLAVLLTAFRFRASGLRMSSDFYRPSTRGDMKGSASESPSASVAEATTTDVQVTPTALLQLDREQASGFWGRRFGKQGG